MAGGLSGYETPTYIYASVLACYLILSIAIEKILHYLDHCFASRKGLKVALKTIVQEVMMLGFITLTLTVVEDPLSEICVDRFSDSGRWVSIANVRECDACLEDTRGLSAIYKKEHQCPFWDDPSSYYASKAAAAGYDYDEEKAHHRRLLAGGEAKICGEGQEPLVSLAVLHEAHLAIFFLVVTHVINVVIMVILANLKVGRWRRWKAEDDKFALCVSAEVKRVTLEPLGDSQSHTVEVRSHAGEQAGAANVSEVTPAPSAEATAEVIKHPDGVLKILKQAKDTAAKNRVEVMVHWQTEWAISFLKQFVRPVMKDEFRIMRAAFMLEHRRVHNFDFMSYLVNALDDDVTEVVKISALGWVVWMITHLLWAPVDYAGPVLLGATLLFVFAVSVICAKLVVVIRHVTREGRVNKLEPDVFWFQNPRLLLPLVRFTLFVNSAIFATLVTLAIEYGPKSCVFTREDGIGGFTETSWILILLLNTLCFFHMSFVMLPTYSLVVHMGSTHWSHHLINEDIKDKLTEWRQRAAVKDLNRVSAPQTTQP